jgi:hypothetical protein
VWLRTHAIVVIHSGALCTATSPHAPGDKSKATEQNGTTNASNDASDDALARRAKTASIASAAAIVVQRRRDCCSGVTSCGCNDLLGRNSSSNRAASSNCSDDGRVSVSR